MRPSEDLSGIACRHGIIHRLKPTPFLPYTPTMTDCDEDRCHCCHIHVQGWPCKPGSRGYVRYFAKLDAERELERAAFRERIAAERADRARRRKRKL